MIVNAVLGSVSTTDYDIVFTELPVPRRKRDEGKFHGGSARMTFEGTEQGTEKAQMAMESLQKYSDSHMSDQALRVQWTTTKKPNTNVGNKDKAKKEVLAERIQLQINRAKSYASRRQRVAQKTDEVIRKSLAVRDGTIYDDHLMLASHMNIPVLHADRLDWTQCTEEINPVRGGGILKGTKQGDRKQAAVEAFLLVLQAALLDDDIGLHDTNNDESNTRKQQRQRHFVADLGCGAGNLSLPLAWWLQKERRGFGILGVDINGHALDRLEKQADRAGVSIETLEEDLLALMSSKNIDDRNDNQSLVENHPLSDCAAVFSLHACGAASDMAMYAAITNKMPFAISPCCIGKLNTSRASSQQLQSGRMPSLSSGERSAAPPKIPYPRSRWLNDAATNYGVGSVSNEAEADKHEIAHCKRLVSTICFANGQRRCRANFMFFGFRFV